MKKVKITLLTMALCLLPLVASATEICFNADGSIVKLCVDSLGSDVYEVHGYIYDGGPTGKIPISGTAVVDGETVTVGFLLDQADEEWNSVVWLIKKHT